MLDMTRGPSMKPVCAAHEQQGALGRQRDDNEGLADRHAEHLPV